MAEENGSGMGMIVGILLVLVIGVLVYLFGFQGNTGGGNTGGTSGGAAVETQTGGGQ